MIHYTPIINPAALHFRYALMYWGKMLPEIKGMIKASVVFGTPGKNCQGLGLCRAEITPSLQQNGNCCANTFAYIGLTKTGRWKMRFPKISTPACIQMKYLQASTFTMEESFQFSKEFHLLFNACDFTIYADNYFIKETKTYYIILF